MTVEDRVRAATRARAGLVREIRPLEIPERLPRRGFRFSRPRRLAGWLAPVTAVAVVVALAIALVSVRQARNESGVPGPAPVPAAGGVAIPRYYVSVSRSLSRARVAATVADSRTGAVLAKVRPPAHRMFAGVTGAADDRTFVLDTVPAGRTYGLGGHVWYLLRIATGTHHHVILTRLPAAVPPVSGAIQGLALSPDGRTLAVMFRHPMPDTNRPHVARAAGDGPVPPFILRTYSLATGHALRTWTAPAPNRLLSRTDNTAALSWVGSRALAFRYPVVLQPAYVRLLDTASKGGDFVTASRSVLAVPGGLRGCANVLTATDGRTVACGTLGDRCLKGYPELDLWSTATGKLTRVLYRYGRTCTVAGAQVLWAGRNGTVIGLVQAGTQTGKRWRTRTVAGLISHGRFTPLHISIPAGAFPDGIAF